MRISFSASADYGPSGYEHRRGEDLANVSRADLRWYYFLGSFRIVHEGVDIGPPWSWVPLFDLVYSLQSAVVFVEGGEAIDRIDSTEKEEAIVLVRNGPEFRMLPTYVSSELTCSVSEFTSATRSFVRSELRRVTVEYSSLARNSHVLEIAGSVGLEIIPGR